MTRADVQRATASRPPSATRIALQVLLWAGPLGVGLALWLLLANARYFHSGPGVPTAGDERAWSAMWGALAMVGAGCCVGALASLAWLAHAWHRRRRPSALEWLRTSLNLLFGAGFFWLWFGR